MDLDSGAGLLHRLTSYVPGRDWDVPVDDPRVRHDLTPNDLETLPPPVKAYDAALPRSPLPRDLPAPDVAATAVLAGHLPGQSTEPLDAARLGRVLFLGAGVVRTSERDGRTTLFRASGSAGARFPLEVYAVTRGVAGVPDGVHWYDPVDHALVRVGPPAAGATTLVVTGVPWRTGWRYAERGWRHLYWDGGTLLAQLTAAAASAGLTPRLRTLFPDAAVTALVGADGVHEFPLALLTFGDDPPPTEPGGPAATGHLPPVEFPLCTTAQRAGDRDTLGEPWPDAPPLPGTPPEAAPLDEVVLRRGSQRRMDRTATVPRGHLEWPVAAALRGTGVPHWVAVHGVDGVPPGVYRWPDLTTPVSTGDHRDELARVCLDQLLAAEAAYVVIAATDLTALDDRTYREAQLAAGLVEGRLHLAAYALGLGATGMTFLDSEVPALLGVPETYGALLFTCVGVPEYASRAGGGPGAPVAVKQVRPRLAS